LIFRKFHSRKTWHRFLTDLAPRRALERSANFGDCLVAIFVQLLELLLQRPKFSGAFGRPFPINIESVCRRWTGRRSLRSRQRRLHRCVVTVGGRHICTPYKLESGRFDPAEFPCGRALASPPCSVHCVVWMPGRGRFGGKRWTPVADLVFLRTSFSTNKMQSTANLADVFLCCSAIVHMSVPHSETALPPRCEICGTGTVRIGKLPRIGLRPLVYVYKCDACNQITSVEPERQEEAIRRRPGAARRPRR